MNRVELKHIPLRPRNPFAGWQKGLHRLFLALFGVALLLVWLRLIFPAALFAGSRWPDGLLLVLAAATTLASLSRQLPAQNVVLAAALIGGFGGAAASVGAITGVPFGPFTYNAENIGKFLFYPLPCAVPILWVVAILNSRGVARLIMRPYRQRPDYGLWLMGVTVLLVVCLDLSFEPYATLVNGYWSWKPTKIPYDWYSAPLSNFSGWATITLLILLFVTPALINKSPVKTPPTWHPLVVWELLSFLFLTGTALRHFWGAALLTAAQMVLIGVLSMLATKRKSRGASPAHAVSHK